MTRMPESSTPASTTPSDVAAIALDARPRRWGGATGAATTVAVILSGLFAGFFVTYHISVIRGLAEVDDVTYVKTFQAINDTIRSAEFAVVFFGTVPAIGLALGLAGRAGRVGRVVVGWLTTGLVLAIATVVITFAGNVPLNRDLAAVDNLTPEVAAVARADFEGPWNRLNLFRTLTAVGSASCVAIAGSQPGRRASR